MSKYKAIIHASEMLTMSENHPPTKISTKATPEFEVINDGGMIIEGSKICFVGTSQEVSNHPLFKKIEDNDVFDATGKVVMPGYVDSHTHFVFGGTREDEYDMRLKGADYMTIMNNGGGIINSVKGTREADFEELVELAKSRLGDMLHYGVTTVEGKSGYGLNNETELKQLRVMKRLDEELPIQIVKTYLGAHSVTEEWKGREDAYIDSLIETCLPMVKKEDLATFCDIFCEKGVFTIEQSRRLLTAAKEMGFKLTIHADEIVDLGGGALAAELKAVSADHLLAISEASIMKMKSANTVATLLPATAFSLREEYAPARQMIDAGLKVALATDYNPGSCPTYSIPLVIALATLQMHMTTEEVLLGLTLHGAKALDLDEEIGSLTIGKQADIIIHDVPSYKMIPYRLGMNTVKYVMKKGVFYVS